MMRHRQSHGNQMHGQWGDQQMHGGRICDQVQPVVCPTQYRHHDQFTPCEVPFIHPIVNVNRQHIVEIPRHYWTETTQNVMGETLQASPGFGPEFGGGFGPEFGRPGRGPWM